MDSKKKYRTPSLGYPGGKSKVAKKIVAKMPPHKKYVEPFAGAAHVFFEKPKAEKNVLNDINSEVIGFFKGLKGKQKCCRITETRERFMKLKNKKAKTPCEYLELNQISYGGRGVTYAVRKNKKRAKETCVNGSKLSNVGLTSEDFRKTMEKNDSKNTLFYIDPPYVKANEGECLYKKGYCDVTPEQVAAATRKLEGKAMVSYDDHPKVRKAFQGFKTQTIELPYSFARDKNKRMKGKKKELLITNF